MLINKPVFKHYNLYFFLSLRSNYTISFASHFAVRLCAAFAEIYVFVMHMWVRCVFFRSVYRLYQLVSSYLQHEIVKWYAMLTLFHFSNSA